MIASLRFPENCLIVYEIERNVFSNTLEHLFLTLQSVCGKVKLTLNQQYINNAQNQTPVVAHFLSKKELGADTA